ncbi:MAG: glycosyltransferase family 2 protein [Tractidigestivibacter sp.]|uniref:glycosyltransferase family 2 protein n=1 Tax=Tractidigestivibacter sp. TaxID=2847320 RepID=UPI003D926BE8
MSRISVVVPCYNVQQYLDWSLGALEDQTFGDFEVICVNDGSTDDTLEELRSWEARDSRIHVVDQPNRGVSAARNNGIKHATGEFLFTLDADDRFTPDAFQTVVDRFDETGADIVTFGGMLWPEGAQDPWSEDMLSPRDVVYDEFSTDVLFSEKSWPYAWRTAVRLSFMRDAGVLFDESLRLGEDTQLQFALYPRAKKIAFSSAKLYQYRVTRDGSAMSSALTDRHVMMLKHVGIVDSILRDWERGGFIEGNGPDIIGFAMRFVQRDALRLSDDEYQEVAQALLKVLQRYWSAEDVRSMEPRGHLSQAEKDMALTTCYRPRASKLTRRFALYEKDAEEQGRRAALKMLLHTVRKELPTR